MKNSLLVLTCIGALGVVGVFAEAASEGKGAEAKLAGVWEGHRLAGGMDKPTDGPAITLTFEGENVKSSAAGSGTFRLDTSKKPIEMNGVKPGGKTIYLGILKTSGEQLVWCVGDPGKPRPTTFETKAGQWCIVVSRKK